MNARMTFRGITTLFVLLFCLLAGLTEAQASHFRFGHLTWQPRPDISPTTVDFTMMGAFRRSGYSGTAPDGRPKIGDLILETIGGTGLNFGDGTSTGTLYFEVTAISPEQDWVIGIARRAQGANGIIRKQYAAPRQSNGQPWVATVSGCCRIDGLRNSASDYVVQAKVDLSIPNTPPISNLPPIVSCPRGQLCSFAIPAVDADGDPVRWRFTPGPQSGIYSLPGGTPPGQPISIESTTGIVSWNTTATATLGLYALSITMEDLAPDGTVKSSSAIDFLLNLQSVANNATPVFDVPPTPARNSTITAVTGRPLSLQIQASDPNPTDLVTLNHVGLPQGATFTPVRGNPAVAVFDWTPGAGDIGERIVTFTAIDSRSAAALPHPVTIKVINSPLREIKVTATVATSQNEIQSGSFAHAPDKIMQQGERTILEWNFPTFNIGESANLDFAALLKSLVGGERRLVTESIELSYQHIDGAQVRRTLPAQFVDVLPSIFQIAVATGRPVYGADELVAISVPVKNLSTFPGDTTARLSVRDGAGQQVSLLGIQPVTGLAGGETRQLSGFQFQTGKTYAGNYQVLAELLDGDGKTIVQAVAPFQIVTDAQAVAVAKISTDKQVYLSTEVARLSDRVTNLALNAALDDLRVITTVKNPDGTVRFSKTEVLPQLPPSQLKDYGYDLILAAAPAGQYAATLVLTKADGTQLAQASTQFSVSSTADTGAGLVGTLTAKPWVNAGQSVQLAFNATNNGNAQLTNVPLTISLVDPNKQQVLAEYPFSATLPVAGSHAGTTTWTANVETGGTYVGILTAVVGGKTLTLAQTPVTVLKLAVTQNFQKENRVLVLVSCNDAAPGAKADSGADQACETQRSQAIGTVLTTLGVSHLITTSEAAFRQAFRSGVYNTYWISGKQDKLHDNLAAEVREAVFAGHGLILDGVHDERNKTLDEAAGITYHGKRGETDLLVEVGGPIFTPQTLATAGRSLKLIASGSAEQAVFNGMKANSDGPAILTNAFGTGRTVMHAFDLVSSMQAQPFWQQVLLATLQHVAPTLPDTLVPGTLVPVKTSVTNQGPATQVSVKASLPDGAVLTGSNPTGSYDSTANSLEWSFGLEEAQTKEVFLTFRVPANAGDFMLRTAASTIREGESKPYGEPMALPIKVVTAANISAELINILNAYALTTKSDQNTRDAVLEAVQDAMASFNKQTPDGYEAAVSSLVRGIDYLTTLTMIDTNGARLCLDRLLRETEWRWAQLSAAASN